MSFNYSKGEKTGRREQSTEFDPILREVDNYPEGDKASSSHLDSSREASSSFWEVVLTKREAWLKKLENSRFTSRWIKSEITNDELKWIIHLYSLKEARLYRPKMSCLVDFLPYTCCTYSEQILKAGGVHPLQLYFIRTFDFFKLAPIELSPNRWRILSLLMIVYHKLGYKRSFTEEICYMYELKSSPGSIGFDYLVAYSKLGYNLIEDYKSNTEGREETEGFSIRSRKMKFAFKNKKGKVMVASSSQPQSQRKSKTVAVNSSLKSNE
ncbi:hypothetical protein PanWU01x14_155860 [Parasponia andersonii]|uniref:Transposase (putative) gypsy type domain-containing protein n=1 Tax=Parasponia andersonii TaxID=3476 RepID=A0A2P5CGA0_PARAD|nr:hypothetical protein PanWU01x14_155860 [Parasponia andersonii]